MLADFSHEDDGTARAHLAAVVESSDDAIISKTLDGIITSWNPAAVRTFGWSVEEAVGKHIKLIIPVERHAEEDDVLARLRRGERIEHFETVRQTKDGRRLDISLTVSPVKDAAGRIIGASKVARDITERRRGEVANARLAAIVESSDDAIVSKTLDGTVTSWNAGAERMFGWTAAEAIGRHIELIIPAERRSEEDEVVERLRRGERMHHFDTVRKTKDGRFLDVSLTVSPIRDTAGRIIGASKIARDITERRRVEAERTELLAREKRARAEAEALNRAKDEFLATVSHELRTPLNAIFGWARMLQSTPMDEAARSRSIGAIVRSASAQAQLIEDLLDVSRIVTGRMRINFAPFDFRTVVANAVEAVRPAASAKGVQLVPRLDERVGAVVGDADRIQQVVWNLVINAVKFTPRGGRVDVSVHRDEREIEIVVEDTGEGIGPETLPHVFERFRQEDSSTTRTHGGLGLGLSLVRHLVELHGGSVRAESPGKGQGATFRVTLPVVAGTRTEADGALVHDGGGPLGGLRVLVVDDDADALELTSIMLRNAGAEVRSASAAVRAYELVASWRPHVLVSDLALPNEDGFMMLRALRSGLTATGGTLPAVAITAYGTAENRARAEEAGYDRYLQKPVEPDTLTGAVAALARR